MAKGAVKKKVSSSRVSKSKVKSMPMKSKVSKSSIPIKSRPMAAKMTNPRVSKSSVPMKDVQPEPGIKNWIWPIIIASVLVLIAAIIIIVKLSGAVVAGNVISGNAITGNAFVNYQDCINQNSDMGSAAATYCNQYFSGSSGGSNYQFFDTAIGKVVTVFIGNPSTAQAAVSSSPLGAGPLGSAGPLIVYLAVWGILFVSFAYVLVNFLFTKGRLQWVSWVVGLGLAAIVSNFGLISVIVQWAAAITATLGAASVFVAIGFAFVTFFVVTFMGNLFRMHHAKNIVKKAKAGGLEAGEAIRMLSEIEGKAAEGSE